MKIVKIVAIVLACIIVVAGSISIGLWEYAKDVYFVNKEDNVAFQQEHLRYLREEYYQNYVSLGEQRFCNFDLEETLKKSKIKSIIFKKILIFHFRCDTIPCVNVNNNVRKRRQ